MGYCMWDPKRIKNVEQDCRRLAKAKGKVSPTKKLNYKSKRRHIVCDYAHQIPKIHCPWDDDAKKKRNDFSPGKMYHGLHSTDVTERLGTKPPTHAAHPSLIDGPTEYHGRQAQDITAMHTFASRGKRPPSRDCYYGREATDISEFLRIIPPVAKDGEEGNEFFGRPKSDITDYNLFPLRLVDTNARFEAAQPLGRCPPGPMCDFKPLVRNKDGHLVKPQPVKPASSLCASGTHEMPNAMTNRGASDGEQTLVPGAPGILAQIVCGISRSEAKKPLGRCVPGVMTDYMPIVRHKTSKVANIDDRVPRLDQSLQPPALEPSSREQCPPSCSEDIRSSNCDARKRPLGNIALRVMPDFNPNPSIGNHQHTTDRYWTAPVEYSRSSLDSCAEHESTRLVKPNPPMSKAVRSQREAAKSVQDRRRHAICEIHEVPCPFGAEQGHKGSCISHPTASSYAKWPKDDRDGKKASPCEKHRGRTGIFAVKGSTHTGASFATGSLGDGSAMDTSRNSQQTNPKSDDSSDFPGGRRQDSQSFLKPYAACPRVACQCIRVARKGSGPPNFGYAETMSKLDSRYPQRNATSGAVVGSALSTRSISRGGGAKTKVATSKQRKKSMAFVTEETSPQHFRVPYFGLAQTYVTNPAISPNPPLRIESNGQENLPARESQDSEQWSSASSSKKIVGMSGENH